MIGSKGSVPSAEVKNNAGIWSHHYLITCLLKSKGALFILVIMYLHGADISGPVVKLYMDKSGEDSFSLLGDEIFRPKRM